MVNDLIEKLQQSSRDEKRQADEARQQAQRVSSELADAKARLTDAKQQHSASCCSARVPPAADRSAHSIHLSIRPPVGPSQDSRPKPKVEWIDVRSCGVDGCACAWGSFGVCACACICARACLCALVMDGTHRCGGTQSEPRERGARAAAQVRAQRLATSNETQLATLRRRETRNIRHGTGLSALCTHASTHHRAWLSEPLLWRSGTGPPNSASLATSAAGLGSPLRLLHKQASRRGLRGAKGWSLLWGTLGYSIGSRARVQCADSLCSQEGRAKAAGPHAIGCRPHAHERAPTAACGQTLGSRASAEYSQDCRAVWYL